MLLDAIFHFPVVTDFQQEVHKVFQDSTKMLFEINMLLLQNSRQLRNEDPKVEIEINVLVSDGRGGEAERERGEKKKMKLIIFQAFFLLN